MTGSWRRSTRIGNVTAAGSPPHELLVGHQHPLGPPPATGGFSGFGFSQPLSWRETNQRTDVLGVRNWRRGSLRCENNSRRWKRNWPSRRSTAATLRNHLPVTSSSRIAGRARVIAASGISVRSRYDPLPLGSGENQDGGPGQLHPLDSPRAGLTAAASKLRRNCHNASTNSASVASHSPRP